MPWPSFSKAFKLAAGDFELHSNLGRALLARCNALPDIAGHTPSTCKAAFLPPGRPGATVVLPGAGYCSTNIHDQA